MARTAAYLKSFFDRVEDNLTAYGLFAIAVLWMVAGHFSENLTESLWLRVTDRILLPVFLIPIGYNAGRRVDWKLAGGAVLVSSLRWFMFHRWLPALSMGYVTILVTIVITRLVLEPLMEFALKSRARFWGASLALAGLAPFTHSHVCEYGTLGILMAMAGWLSRNRGQEPKPPVEPSEFFLLVYFYYIAFNQSLYEFSAPQLAVTAAGTAVVFRLLWDFRRLLLNSLRSKPADIVARVARFTGGNSLEIYTLHMIAYYGIYYYALGVAAGP
ncbi:MAG: hypothetical protein EPN97_12955 [Alphaproteobacteria bacterium]|nr:MAG: hypothetical protein EPN97_12955 [Alphaproteobacteria bacterium]